MEKLNLIETSFTELSMENFDGFCKEHLGIKGIKYDGVEYKPVEMLNYVINFFRKNQVQKLFEHHPKLYNFASKILKESQKNDALNLFIKGRLNKLSDFKAANQTEIVSPKKPKPYKQLTQSKKKLKQKLLEQVAAPVPIINDKIAIYPNVYNQLLLLDKIPHQEDDNGLHVVVNSIRQKGFYYHIFKQSIGHEPIKLLRNKLKTLNEFKS
jgi:hypothetical protein